LRRRRRLVLTSGSPSCNNSARGNGGGGIRRLFNLDINNLDACFLKLSNNELGSGGGRSRYIGSNPSARDAL
jgi:hypothetical protein